MNLKLADLIGRIQSSQSFDVRSVQKEISALWDELDAEDDRVTLLKIHQAVMDLIERTGGLTPDALERFQGAREAEYRLFLMKEAMLDGENVDPDAFDRITAREVASGRMAPDSDYRALASAAGAVLGSPKPRKAGWFGKLFK